MSKNLNKKSDNNNNRAEEQALKERKDSRIVDNFVDNAISATNLANNLAMVNMETIQQLTDGSRAFWRTGVENVRTMSESLSQQ